MNRYIISLSYKGTRYSGWQRQTTNPKTVQEKLETVLLHINKKPVIASGASRTDSGVHALDQKVMFNLDKEFDTKRLMAKINSRLPLDIRVNKIKKVPLSYNLFDHIREKTYVYNLSLSSPNALESETTAIFENIADFNIELFQKALKLFIGRHDFTSFSSLAGRPPHREVFEIKCVKNSQKLEITLRANGFLKYMIRYIIGASIQVGLGTLELTKIKSELKKPTKGFKPRRAPANGLILKKIYL